MCRPADSRAAGSLAELVLSSSIPCPRRRRSDAPINCSRPSSRTPVESVVAGVRRDCLLDVGLRNELERCRGSCALEWSYVHRDDAGTQAVPPR